MEHRVTIKKVTSRGQWEGQCGACSFWTGMAGLGTIPETRVREAAAFHEEQVAKKEAARAKRRVQR